MVVGRRADVHRTVVGGAHVVRGKTKKTQGVRGAAAPRLNPSRGEGLGAKPKTGWSGGPRPPAKITRKKNSPGTAFRVSYFSTGLSVIDALPKGPQCSGKRVDSLNQKVIFFSKTKFEKVFETSTLKKKAKFEKILETSTF